MLLTISLPTTAFTRMYVPLPLHRAADFNPLAVRREAPSINGVRPSLIRGSLGSIPKGGKYVCS